jgi:hypothetical protein
VSAPTTPREVLLAAAELIEKPGAWTRKAYARDPFMQDVHPTSRDACCWCMAGAVWRAAGAHSGLEAEALAALRDASGRGVSYFNDAPGRTQAECVAMLRKAAEVAPS